MTKRALNEDQLVNIFRLNGEREGSATGGFAVSPPPIGFMPQVLIFAHTPRRAADLLFKCTRLNLIQPGSQVLATQVHPDVCP